MILLDSQLIAFEAIVREGTVNAAAKSIFLTQTAVTQRLRQLEQKLKTTLFIRSRRGMILTSEGEQLHRYCQRVTEMSGAVLANIQGAGVSSSLRLKIVGPSTKIRTQIIPQCQSVMKAFPKLNISFLIDDSPDISQQLKSGAVDLAVLCPEQVTLEMESKSLLAEQYVLICSSKWKHRSLIDIIQQEKIIDYDHEDQMTFTYLKKYDLFEYIQSERHFVNNTESIAELFIAECGYGVLTKEVAKPYIELGDLFILNENKTYLYAVSLAWYARPQSTPYFSSIIDAIK